MLGGDLPCPHDQDSVGERDRLVDIVGDQQHRRPVPGDQLPDELVHLDPGQCVEGGERLVEQQQFRLADQRPGEGDPLRLPTGEGDRPRLEMATEADLRQRGGGLLLSLAPRQPDRDVAPDPFPRQQPVLLEHHRPLRRHVDCAGVGLVEAGEGPQQGGLAAAALAQQGDELTGGDVDVEPVDDDLVLIGAAQATDPDEGRSPGGRGIRGLPRDGGGLGCHYLAFPSTRCSAGNQVFGKAVEPGRAARGPCPRQWPLQTMAAADGATA